MGRNSVKQREEKERRKRWRQMKEELRESGKVIGEGVVVELPANVRIACEGGTAVVPGWNSFSEGTYLMAKNPQIFVFGEETKFAESALRLEREVG